MASPLEATQLPSAHSPQTHAPRRTYTLRTILRSVKNCIDSTNPECMYIDFESWYSDYALVLPSRCAEAVKLSRLGHNRERKGREVHPPGDVVGTQRNI